MKRFVSLFFAILTLSLAGFAHAATDTARARLDAFAHDLHSLTGRFTQTLTDPNGRDGKTSSGTLALEAPRQFRWDTLAPYKQTIVADGSRVWLYDPELEQVTVRTQSSAESHSPLTVLTNVKRMDQEFTVTEEGAHDGLLWLRLTSKAKDPQFDHAELGFGEDGLDEMVFRDQLGATTQIRFSDWKRNANIPDSTFNFTPPPGADVIGDAPVLTTQPIKD